MDISQLTCMPLSSFLCFQFVLSILNYRSYSVKIKIEDTFGVVSTSKPYLIMFAKIYRIKYSNYPIV